MPSVPRARAALRDHRFRPSSMPRDAAQLSSRACWPSQRSRSSYLNDPDTTREQILSGHGSAGYIVIGARYSTIEDVHQTVDEREKRDVPFVMTNAPDPRRAISQVVVHGNRSSSVIQHLLDMGHSRLSSSPARSTTPSANKRSR